MTRASVASSGRDLTAEEVWAVWNANNAPGPLQMAAAIQSAYRQVNRISDPRFIMDHGMWHDIQTGQHLYTQDQHDAEVNSIKDDAWAALSAAGIERGILNLDEAITMLARRVASDASALQEDKP